MGYYYIDGYCIPEEDMSYMDAQDYVKERKKEKYKEWAKEHGYDYDEW